MATWDSYTQKSTPADNDTLMIKDTSGGANKRTPFSGVWNWIVSKLASAVISQLETTNKSIIPAINELNSKSFFTLGGTRIPENADMNNYTEPGNYSLDVGSYLTSIKNAPKMNYAFDLNVGRALGDYTAQIFREYVTGNIAYRIYRGDHWEDYRYFKSESDAFTTTLTNNIDYNDLPSGIHYCGTGCAHAPETNCKVICLYGSGGTVGDALQIAFSLLNPCMYTRVSRSSKWQNWTKFTGTSIS